MSSAGPSSPRVVTLTADQLLGTSLTPARPHKQPKNAPRVLTIEDLLGPGLTVARSAPKPVARPTPRSPPRPSGSSSTRNTPNPRLVRVTADEVLRTGIPVRTLQVVKARSGQAQVVTAEELLAASSSRLSGRSVPQTRGRTTANQPLAAPSGSSGGSGATASRAGQSQGSATSSAQRSRDPRSAHSGTGGRNESTEQSRTARGQARRSNSLGSTRTTRTLPMYTQEPGDSEVIIDRGATELEDDDGIPSTAMSPVDENEPDRDSPASAGATASPPGSPTQPADGAPLTCPLSPTVGTPPIASSLPSDLPPWSAIYAEAAPSYEASMSTPNLHTTSASPVDVPPLPSSPLLNSLSPPSSQVISASPTLATISPTRPTIRVSESQPSPPSQNSPGSRSPSSPARPPVERADGAASPRRRFGFISLFHSRSSSRLRSHSHSHASSQSSRSHSRTGSASAVPTPRVASPDLLTPTRPFHRMSQSASGSMLDLASRSRSNS
ncbi:hypothetical protein BV20DRAFT_964065 [Pilatotrama ljubarskyi]|nr:hypothetical protein BV20DRAFT_964065 [Pilatotrama ljubarskyi]